jgi:hypothetical protein
MEDKEMNEETVKIKIAGDSEDSFQQECRINDIADALKDLERVILLFGENGLDIKPLAKASLDAKVKLTKLKLEHLELESTTRKRKLETMLENYEELANNSK